MEINNIDYITPATATVFASVKSDGGAEVSSRGICWSTSENPDYSDSKTSNGEGGGAYSGNITNLSPETKYYVRAYATNSEGVGYSQQESFTTRSDIVPPDIGTEIISYTKSEAHIKGNIINEGGVLITVSGICWSTNQNPDINESHTTGTVIEGEFPSIMAQLIPETKYFVKAYATTILVTFYGNEINFTTLSESDSKVTDIEGNTYKVVVIGNQTWMAENLKTITLNDGEIIPEVTDDNTWGNLSTSAYCFYNNDIAYKDTYGALYNHMAVETGKLCPTGWHVPSIDEWIITINLLDGPLIAGNKLKEVGFSHWSRPNEGATNESGFTGLPAGIRENGVFIYISYLANFWSANFWEDPINCSPRDENSFGTIFLTYDSPVSGPFCGSHSLGTNGLSVRCLKDNM